MSEMTRYEMDKLVSRIADEVVRRIEEKKRMKNLVSAEEAAAILGISRNRLYRLKDHFSHVQREDHRLFFVKDELKSSYATIH